MCYHPILFFIRQKKNLKKQNKSTENHQTLCLLLHIQTAVSLTQNQASRINPISLQSRRCLKAQAYIRPHMPALVYCEVFTKVRFGKDICVRKATRVHSQYKSCRSHCWALEKQTNEEQKHPPVDNNRTAHDEQCFSNPTETLSHDFSAVAVIIPDVLHLWALLWSLLTQLLHVTSCFFSVENSQEIHNFQIQKPS